MVVMATLVCMHYGPPPPPPSQKEVIIYIGHYPAPDEAVIAMHNEAWDNELIVM